jgi:MFS family permease
MLVACVSAFMQTHIHRVAAAPLIPIFIADLGLSYTAAATVMSAYFWTYMTVQVPVGLLTDRLGARRVMLVFMALLVVGVAAFAASQSYAQMLVARCLVGLGAAAVWLPGLRLVSEWFPAQERGRATGVFSSGGGLGATAALLIVPVLAERFGWRVGYGLTLIPALLTFALIALVVRAGPPGGDSAPATVPEGRAVAPVAARSFSMLADVLGSRLIWPFNIATALWYGGYISLITWLPTFLTQSEGLSRGAAGTVTALITAGTVVSWPLAGVLSDHFGRRKAVYLASQALMVPACLAFAFVVPGQGMTTAAAAAFVTGLTMGGMITPFVMVAELFPAHLVGTASGVVNTFCFVGGLVVPVLLGRVLDVSGSFAVAFATCAGAQAAAVLVAAFTEEPRLASGARHGSTR